MLFHGKVGRARCVPCSVVAPSFYLVYFDCCWFVLQVIGKQMDASCRNRCREQGIEYFRFNPQLHEKVDSAQHDSAILQDMVFTTRQYLRETTVKDDMDRLVKLLMKSELTSTENTSNRQ